MNRRRKKQISDTKMLFLKGRFSSLECQQLLHFPSTIWGHLPKLHRTILSFLIPVVVLLVFIPWPASFSTGDQNDDKPLQRVNIELEHPEALSENDNQRVVRPSPARSNTVWVAYQIKQGDTLSRFFRKNQLSLADLNALLEIEGSDKPLSEIKPGQLIRYKLTAKGQLDILQLEKENQSVMFFRLSNGGFGRSK